MPKDTIHISMTFIMNYQLKRTGCDKMPIWPPKFVKIYFAGTKTSNVLSLTYMYVV